MREYDIFADSLYTRFRCLHCGKEIVQRITKLPSPNWSGDTVAESQVEADDSFACPFCKQEYEVDLYANIYYGEMNLQTLSGEMISDLEIKNEYIHDIDENKMMKKNFNEWFSERVKTQYGDLSGVAYVDGNEGPHGLRELVENTGVDLVNKAILGVEFSGIDNRSQEIGCTVYLVEQSLLEEKGLEHLDYDRDVEEEMVEHFTWDLFNTYIKRLSFGFVMPSHLRKE